MKCTICGKDYPPEAGYMFCPGCGGEVFDDEREDELRRQMMEVATARRELDRNRAEGRVDDAAYDPLAKTLERNRTEIEAELAEIEEIKRQAKSGWVRKKLSKAVGLLDAGRLDEAYAAVQSILGADPTNPSVHAVMARVLSKRGHLSEAIRAARYAQSLDPSNTWIADYVRSLETSFAEQQQREVDRAESVKRFGDEYGWKEEEVPPRVEAPGREPFVRATSAYTSNAYGVQKVRRPRAKRKKPDLTGWIRGLVDTGFLKWWYFVGTFILLAGIIGLVTWQWSRIGTYFVFTLVVLANVGLYLLAYFLSKRVRLGSTIIFAIASLLVPLNIYLFSYYSIGGVPYDNNILGIAGSLVAAAIYGINYYRSRNNVMLAFSALTPLSLLFFILRASGTSVHFYGLWFAGLAVCYFIAGYMLRRKELSVQAKVIYGIANGAVALALLSTIGDFRYFMDEGFKTSGLLVGLAAVALLIGSYAYEDRILAYVSSGMVLMSTYFLVQQPGYSWYLATPGLTLAAGALLVLGFLDSMLMPEHDGKPFVRAALVALLGIIAALAVKDLVMNIPQAWGRASQAEMRSSLISALLITGLLWAQAIIGKRKYLAYIASAALVYSSLIFLGYWVDSIALWCLVEATMVAGSLLVLGLVLEKTMGDDWALTAYVPAVLVAGLSTITSMILYLPVISRDIIPGLARYDHGYLSVSVTSLLATFYLVIATIRTRRPEWLYGACVTGAIAYSVQIHVASSSHWVKELSAGGINYGMLIVPLMVVFAVAAHLVKRAGHDDFSIPLFIGLAGTATFSLISQFYYVSQGASAAVALTFGAFLVISVVETVIWKRGEFLYPAILSAFLMGREVIALTVTGTGVEMNYPLFLTPIAASLVIAGAILVRSRDRQQYAIPMLVTSALFLVAGLIYQMVSMTQGLGYSVHIYLFVWSAICGISAFLTSQYRRDGWTSVLPELLAFVSLGHLIIGIGYLTFTLSNSYAAVAMSMMGLSVVLAVASALAGSNLPDWLDRPLSFGTPVAAVVAVVCSLAYPNWDKYYANVISVLVLALTFVATSLRTRDNIFDRVALGAYALATGLSFVYFSVTTGRSVTDVALTWQCVSLAVMAVLAIVSSEYYEDVIEQAAGHIFAALAWLGAGWLLNLYPTYQGYWLAGLAVIITATSFIHYIRNQDNMAAVGWVSSAVLFLASIIQPMVLGYNTQAIVNMSLALAAGTAAVLMYGEERLTYVPLGISVLETVYILAVVRPTIRAGVASLIIMGPAIAYLAASWLLADYRERVSDIFLQFSTGMTAIATIYAIYGLAVRSGENFAVAALFTAGAIYAAVGVFKDYPFMAHISFVHFFTGYVLILVDTHIPHMHLYFLPVGLYIIALGYYCESRGYSRRAVRLLHLVGFATLALSSLIPSIREQGGLHAMILLTESVAALVVGVWQRRKVFLISGLTFIVIDGAVRLRSPGGSLHWSVYALVVGALVIITGILIETKKDVLRQKGAAILQQFKLWK